MHIDRRCERKKEFSLAVMSPRDLFDLIQSSNPARWQEAVDYMSASPDLSTDYKISLAHHTTFASKIPLELLIFPFLQTLYSDMLEKLKLLYNIELE